MKRKPVLFLVACGAATALISLVGCDVTTSDVETARNNVIEEQRETEEARAAGDQAVRAAEENEKRLRETAMRDARENADERLRSAAEETAEAKREREARVAKEEKETAEAKARAERLAAELAATRARDAYVIEAEAELKKIDTRISIMKDQSSQLQGEELAAHKTKIEVLEIRREAVSDAIAKLKAAEVLQWETEKATVDTAIKTANKEDD